MPTSPYLTKAEAAEYLRITEKALSRLVEDRRIRALQPGGRRGRYFFTRADLDAYMNQRVLEAS